MDRVWPRHGGQWSASQRVVSINRPVVRVKLTELLDAFEFVSGDQAMESEAFVSRETGLIYWRSEAGDEVESSPQDIEDPEKYISVPHKYDLDLGSGLAIRFAEEVLPGSLDEAREIFRRRGAYSRFKELLLQHGKLTQWYEYEAAAKTTSLREWSGP